MEVACSLKMVYCCDYNKTPHASSYNAAIAYFPPFTCRIRVHTNYIVNDNKFRTNDVMRNPKNHSPIWLFVTSNKVVRKPLSSFPCLPETPNNTYRYRIYVYRILWALVWSYIYDFHYYFLSIRHNIACRQQLAPNWAQAHCAYTYMATSPLSRIQF